MKQITLSLSDAQFERLSKIGALVDVEVERLLIGQAFAGIDGWGDDAKGFLETLDWALEYADTGRAAENPGEGVELNLPVEALLEEARILAAAEDAS